MYIVICNFIVMIFGDNLIYSVNYLNYSEMKILYVNLVMIYFNIYRMCIVLFLYQLEVCQIICININVLMFKVFQNFVISVKYYFDFKFIN